MTTKKSLSTVKNCILNMVSIFKKFYEEEDMEIGKSIQQELDRMAMALIGIILFIAFLVIVCIAGCCFCQYFNGRRNRRMTKSKISRRAPRSNVDDELIDIPRVKEYMI